MKIAQGAILATALVGIGAGAAWAESPLPSTGHWVRVSQGEAGSGYVSAKPIIRAHDYAVIWSLRNYPDARALGDKQVRSMKSQVEYNCASHQRRAVYAAMYAGRMARGKLVDLSYSKNRWQAVPVAASGYRYACTTVPQPAVIASAP